MTINVKVTPFIVGNIQMLMVVNTPNQVYYENIYERIGQIVSK